MTDMEELSAMRQELAKLRHDLAMERLHHAATRKELLFALSEKIGADNPPSIDGHKVS